MIATPKSHEKPRRANKRRGGVVVRRLVPERSKAVSNDLVNQLIGETGQLSHLPNVLPLLPPAADGGDVLLGVAGLILRTTALGSVFTGSGRFGFRGFESAEAAERLSSFVCHNEINLPNRLGFASGKSNYFAGGDFGPRNAQGEGPMEAKKDL
jgi:hypothetical protein